VVLGSHAAKGRRFFNVTFLLPFGIPAYAGGLTWQFIFQAKGTANSLLSTLHLPGATSLWMTGNNAFLGNGHRHHLANVAFVFLMLMAATQSISQEVLEALRIDGAAAGTRPRTSPFGMSAPRW